MAGRAETHDLLRVEIDPVDGSLVSPDDESPGAANDEPLDEERTAGRAAARALAQPRERLIPGGGSLVRLERGARQLAVVRIGADGALHWHCVEPGADAAALGAGDGRAKNLEQRAAER